MGVVQDSTDIIQVFVIGQDKAVYYIGSVLNEYRILQVFLFCFEKCARVVLATVDICCISTCNFQFADLLPVSTMCS